MDNNMLYYLNSAWILIAAALVLIMHAGFLLVETGFTQSKNAANITMKNLVTIAVGVLCFYLVGYGFMYGTGGNSIIGLGSFMLGGSHASPNLNFEIYFLFQAIFCATCATIVSGAVAERAKFSSYIVFCVISTAFIYPLIGHWVWSADGFLNKMGFKDFAGGTAVHAVGGMCALVGAAMVGPRHGKYRNGKPRAIPGHNLIYAALGVLLLWFGWFGFNGGSALNIADPRTANAVVVTAIGGAAGTISTIIFTVLRYKKPDVGLIMNGALAGLVGVTPGADVLTYNGAIIVAAVLGILMVLSVEFFDKVVKIDDPVGAISVHGVCGSLGTICVGLFAKQGGLFYGGGLHLLGIQSFGILLCLAVVGALSFISFYLIKKTIGLRVSEEEEITGLDLSEHGIAAYTE